MKFYLLKAQMENQPGTTQILVSEDQFEGEVGDFFNSHHVNAEMVGKVELFGCEAQIKDQFISDD